MQGVTCLRGLLAGLCISVAAPVLAADIAITYVERQIVRPPVLSNLQDYPEGLGRDGARLAQEDNQTSGKFLKQNYSLAEITIAPEENFIEAMKAKLAETGGLILLSAPKEDILALADMPEAQDVLIFNVSSPDVSLRSGECRANLLHSIPSLAMRSDALAQFLMWKRWDDLAMIAGANPEDRAYAEAMKHSLEKFGLSLAGEKEWAFDADMRRSASAEVPSFTQSLPDHDVLLVADERHDFARYIAYNTWVARPLAGSEGLQALGWAPVVEQWGAAQLQGRFRDLTGRDMQEEDFATWAASRSIAEAVTRTGKTDPASLRAYILSDEFELAGFLGRPLGYRGWNGQMRQPIPLVSERALVAQAPLEGFLHQRNELDSLGLDEPDSNCQKFGG